MSQIGGCEKKFKKDLTKSETLCNIDLDMSLVSTKFSLRSECLEKGFSPTMQHTNYAWAQGDRS